MKGELERTERGRDYGRGGVMQMWKGEDGMDVASSIEEDDGDEERKGKTRRCQQLPFPNP